MTNPHHAHQLTRYHLGVLLPHKLRKDALEIRKLHQRPQLQRCGVCQNLPFRYNDDTVANLFDHLQYMRDLKYRLALGCKLLQQVLEQPRRHNIQSGQSLIKHQQLWVMQQRRGNQYLLFHSL